jgi:hypothetical protein
VTRFWQLFELLKAVHHFVDVLGATRSAEHRTTQGLTTTKFLIISGVGRRRYGDSCRGALTNTVPPAPTVQRHLSLQIRHLSPPPASTKAARRTGWHDDAKGSISILLVFVAKGQSRTGALARSDTGGKPMLRCCWRARRRAGSLCYAAGWRVWIQAGSLCYAAAGALGYRLEAYATLALARSETGAKPMLRCCWRARRRAGSLCYATLLGGVMTRNVG